MIISNLKEKSCNRIKGRGCDDGWKQKEEATSPTVSLEAVFLTVLVEATENKDVAVADIPGAYLHVDMDDEVFVCFEGTIAEKKTRINYEES